MTYTPSGSRVASLADRLQRPPHHTPPAAHAPEQAPTRPAGTGRASSKTETPQATPPTQARTDPPQPRAGRAIDGVGAARQISFLLTPDLRDRLRRQMAHTDATMAEVILDAVEATHPALDQLLADEQPQARTGPLFTRAPKPTTAAVKVQVNVRLPSAAISTLDQLVDDHRARNRTQLIAVALNHHLTPEGRAAHNGAADQ